MTTQISTGGGKNHGAGCLCPFCISNLSEASTDIELGDPWKIKGIVDRQIAREAVRDLTALVKDAIPGVTQVRVSLEDGHLVEVDRGDGWEHVDEIDSGFSDEAWECASQIDRSQPHLYEDLVVDERQGPEAHYGFPSGMSVNKYNGGLDWVVFDVE